MNTTATTYSSEHSWTGPSRRESFESIQGKETDIVCDTSDTETFVSDGGEFEPVTEPEGEAPFSGHSSDTDGNIITTQVLEVSVGDDGELVFADSEQTDSGGQTDSDEEMDLYDYWTCAQCLAANNNPIYRYCEKCYKVRKSFFPPRPKRKNKRNRLLETIPRTVSNDSGVESAFNSQELSQLSQNSVNIPELSENLSQNDLVPSQILNVPLQNENVPSTSKIDSEPIYDKNTSDKISECSNQLKDRLSKSLKRRADSADRKNKRMKIDYSDTDTDSELDRRVRKSKSADPEVKPLVKTISDPSLTLEKIEPKITKKGIAKSLKEKLDTEASVETNDNLCIICVSEPKSGVFVHGRIAHICCCYRCAVKVWVTAKRCPVCNCKVSNVLKAIVT